MLETLSKENRALRLKFLTVFCSNMSQLDELPSMTFHCFKLKSPNITIARRHYDCAKQYRQAWKQLLDEHLAAGRMRASDFSYSLPCFLISKADPTVPPCWVYDYRILNANTVPNRHLLPSVAETLGAAPKVKDLKN